MGKEEETAFLSRPRHRLHSAFTAQKTYTFCALLECELFSLFFSDFLLGGLAFEFCRDAPHEAKFAPGGCSAFRAKTGQLWWGWYGLAAASAFVFCTLRALTSFDFSVSLSYSTSRTAQLLHPSHPTPLQHWGLLSCCTQGFISDTLYNTSFDLTSFNITIFIQEAV